jgi:formyltetrahydrofolate hydrolase
VLAGYIQILSPEFVAPYMQCISNRHPSFLIPFLPAFVGAKPYHQAFARDVKLIGANSHYVTAALDQGPIIEGRDQLEERLRKGRDLERLQSLDLARKRGSCSHLRCLGVGKPRSGVSVQDGRVRLERARVCPTSLS